MHVKELSADGLGKAIATPKTPGLRLPSYRPIVVNACRCFLYVVIVKFFVGNLGGLGTRGSPD
jgi:hypothetical protein